MQIEIYGDTLCALVTAASLASTGHEIILKVPPGRVAQALTNGKDTYVEPDLTAMLEQNQANITYGAITQPIDLASQAVFIALETKQFALAENIIQQLEQHKSALLVVNQTTFPVGTSEDFAARLTEHAVICLPDVLQEGQAIDSFIKPNWFILGHQNFAGIEIIKEILHPFTRAQENFLFMPLRDAEFTKLAISGMLATRVTFMNDLANVAEKVGVDIENIRRGIGSDSRIGASYLYPGCGFGGSSFSRDINVLTQTVAQVQTKSNFFEQILAINEAQKEILFRKFWTYYQADVVGKTVAIWGAAFKPNTDKVANAPVLNLIDAFLAQGVKIQIHDPQALDNLRQYYAGVAGIEYCSDQYAAAQGADALLLVTEWRNYWSPNFTKLKHCMRQPLIIDGRNIYTKQQICKYGFDYLAIGRT